MISDAILQQAEPASDRDVSAPRPPRRKRDRIVDPVRAAAANAGQPVPRGRVDRGHSFELVRTADGASVRLNYETGVAFVATRSIAIPLTRISHPEIFERGADRPAGASGPNEQERAELTAQVFDQLRVPEHARKADDSGFSPYGTQGFTSLVTTPRVVDRSEIRGQQYTEVRDTTVRVTDGSERAFGVRLVDGRPFVDINDTESILFATPAQAFNYGEQWWGGLYDPSDDGAGWGPGFQRLRDEFGFTESNDADGRTTWTRDLEDLLADIRRTDPALAPVYSGERLVRPDDSVGSFSEL
jgi:hypothetical protein